MSWREESIFSARWSRRFISRFIQGELAVAELVEETLNHLRHVFEKIEIAGQTFFCPITDSRKIIALRHNLSYLWFNMGHDIKLRVELLGYSFDGGQGLDQEQQVAWVVNLITLEHAKKI